MTTRRWTMVRCVGRLFRGVTTAGLVATAATSASAQDGAATKQEQSAAPRLTSLALSFKLDPALTHSMYMGDRWVSPRVFSSTSQPGDSVTVVASVRGLDVAGRPVRIEPTWSPSDPSRVSVTPPDGREVKITVRGAGDSRLRVRAANVEKELTIKAVQQHGATHVEIAQTEPPAPVGAAPRETRTSSQATTGAATTADPELRDERARNSYAAGVRMGTSLKDTAADFDPDLVARGVKDALTGSTNRLTADEMKAALAALRTDFEAKRVEARAQLSEKNREEGEVFLAENKAKEGVVSLETGLQYKVLKAGDGARPTGRDRVVCHYRGSFIDGTEFDSSYKRGKPITMPLTRVIKGWSQALQLMPVGSRWQLFIPPGLAYGQQGGRKNGIGPNKTLVFEVELLGIRGKSQAAATPDRAVTKESSNLAPQP